MKPTGFGAAVKGTRVSVWGIAGLACTVLTSVTMPLLMLLVVGLQASSGEVALSDHCSAAWCANRRDNATMKAQLQELLAEQVAEQLAARPDCTRTPHLSETALVTKARGRVGDGLGMVLEVPLEQAFAQARAGQVWVRAWCG